MKPITAEEIAYKSAALENGYTPEFAKQLETHPRLTEALWFLQKLGPEKVAGLLVATYPERLGTPAMIRLGQKKYTLADCETVAAEVPGETREYYQRETVPASGIAFSFWHSVQLQERDGDTYVKPHKRNPDAFARLTREKFEELCRKAAACDLAERLQYFCTLPETPARLIAAHWRGETNPSLTEDRPLEPVWYFHDLPAALVEFMDRHADREASGQAETQVAIKMRDGFDYAYAQKGMVQFFGRERFGKSHAAKTYCQMYPGRARYIRLPSGSSTFDLLSALGTAFDMLVTPSTNVRELKSTLEFVIKNSRLLLILDESHFIFPSSPRKLASPKRLNWIRTNIVDVDCPIALISTPQDYSSGVKTVKESGHNIAQFLGGTILNVPLPDALSEADLRAVARFHFPDIDSDYLELIMGKALRAEGFLMAIQGIAKRAAWLAQRDGRQKIALADVRQAADEFIAGANPPAPAAAPVPAPALRLHHPAPAPTRAANRATRPALEPLAATPRSITPLTETQRA